MASFSEISHGGVVVGGNSVNAKGKKFRHIASGGAIVGSQTKYGISGYKYIATGSIAISGVSVPNNTFYVDRTLLWNTRARIFSNTKFSWNTGRLINYWYRILAKDKCDHDPCCQRYIINVHARSLSELCDKLTKRRYNFKIESAQQFLMPADNSEVAELEALSIDLNCNTWTPVPLCNIPKCEEFCVDYDLTIDFTFDIFRSQINSFYHHEATSGAFLTGSAIASHNRLIPHFTHEASGGISFDDGADYISTGYGFEASGEFSLSGSAGIRSSSWHFTGGECPNTSRVRFGEETESLSDESDDQVWSLTERILTEDGLFASTDISYAKTSEFLIVRGFDFNIPENSNILHIYVTVQRKANQTGVQDKDVYMLVGDEIISENLANADVDWPYLMESTTTYDFTEEFDVDDLNNHDIGFGIRCFEIDSISPTIASVDFIMIEVVYENIVHQRIRMGGTADVISNAYSWSGSGGISVAGTSKLRSGFKYTSTGESVVISGTYNFGFSYEGTGGISIGGSSNARPSFQSLIGMGGANVGGLADVKPYLDIAKGGLNTTGTALTYVLHKVPALGGVVAGGVGVPQIQNFIYVASGGIDMSGTANQNSSGWSYVSTGNVVFILGGADYRKSDFGTMTEEYEFVMTVDNMLVEFALDQDLHDAKGLNTLVARCGCDDIPLVLNLEQFIARDNNFAQFLRRNSFTISNRLTMQYNSPNDSWQTNLHYKGLSADTNTEETWDIVFDVQCTQDLGSIFIGTKIWKFGMEVVRRNETTGMDFDTRILIGLLPEKICGANELKFKFSLDTKTFFTEVTPAATIYQSLLYDNIGLFKNVSWTNNPNVVFTVSQVGLDSIQNRLDLTSQVLVD